MTVITLNKIKNSTEKLQLLIDSLIYHGVCDNRSKAYTWLAERIYLSSSTIRGYDLVKNRSIHDDRLLRSFSVVSQAIDNFIEITEKQFESLPLIDIRERMCSPTLLNNEEISDTYAIFSQSILASDVGHTSCYTEEIVNFTKVSKEFYLVKCNGFFEGMDLNYYFEGIGQRIEDVFYIEGSIIGLNSEKYLLTYFSIPPEGATNLFGYQVVRSVVGQQNFVRRKVVFRKLDKPYTPNSHPRPIADSNLTTVEKDYLLSDEIVRWRQYMQKLKFI